MGGLSVGVKLDTRELMTWGNQALKAMQKDVRSAVDKTARLARREAVKVLAADANVPAARLRKALPLVKGAKGGGPVYSAVWNVGKSANVIRAAGGAAPAFTRGVPIQASTFQVTGGGSAALSLPKGFVITGTGGSRLVVVRTGKGRSDFKTVYAEDPRTAMSQDDNVVRQAWEHEAKASLGKLLGVAVEAALQGRDSPPGLASADPEGTAS